MSSYKKLPRKNISLEKQKDIDNFTIKTIKQQPLNSVANIARQAAYDPLIHSKYELKPVSLRRYVRVVINDPTRVKKGAKVWVRLDGYDSYVKLTDDEIYAFKSIYERLSAQEQGAFTIMAEYDAGELDEKLVKEELFDNAHKVYQVALKEFKEQYKFQPFLVNELELVEL